MRKFLLIVFVPTLFLSCNFGLTEGQGNGGKMPVVETHEYESQEDGSYLFCVNDPDLIDSDGTTFIAYDADSAESGAFSYGVSLCKSYGNENGGFGLIFQRTDEADFWVFDIDVRGYYYLAKVSGGVEYAAFSTPWQYAAALHTGYGSTNLITVTFDGIANYSVSANGEEVVAFTDSRFGDVLRGGCFGLNAVLMPGEDFPETAVRVCFKIIEPVSIVIDGPSPNVAAFQTIGKR